MSESRKLIIISLVALFLAVGVITFLIGIIEPFWCDKPGVSFFTCYFQRKSYSGQAQSGSLDRAALPQDSLLQTPEIPILTPETPPTLMAYESIEEAAAEDPSLADFLAKLKAAVEEKDFGSIENLIAVPFNIAPYGTSYATLSKEEAMERLRNELEDLNVILDITDEGRSIAHELYATPREASFALVSYGWPEDSISILGIKRTETGYAWSDLILFVSR